MKRRRMVVTSALLGMVMLTGSAQPKEVLVIDQMYQEVKSDLEFEAMQEARASLSTTEPGIGQRTVSIGYAFHQLSISDDDPDAWRPQIRLAWASYNIAASLFVNIEYLFDENGECILWVQRTEGSECGERRYYLGNGKLIGLAEGVFDVPCEEDVDSIIPDREIYIDFTLEEQRRAAAMLLRAASYVSAFPALSSAAQIEFRRP